MKHVELIEIVNKIIIVASSLLFILFYLMAFDRTKFASFCAILSVHIVRFFFLILGSCSVETKSTGIIMHVWKTFCFF